MRRTVKLVTVNNNGAAGTQSIQMPISYDYICGTIEGQTIVAADMDNFQLLMNGIAIQNMTGADRDNINQSDLLASMSSDNMLRVSYELPRMKLPAQQYSTTLNTIAAEPGTNASIGTLETQWDNSTTDNMFFWAEVDDYEPNAADGSGGPGLIERFTKVQIALTESNNYSSSLNQYIQNVVGVPAFRWVHAMYLLAASGTFANGETRIYRGSQQQLVFDRDCPTNARILTDAGVRAIPADYETAAGGMIISFSETGMAELLDTMQPAPAGAQSGVPGAVFQRSVGGNSTALESLISWPNFNPVMSPTETGAGTLILRTVGNVS